MPKRVERIAYVGREALYEPLLPEPTEDALARQRLELENAKLLSRLQHLGSGAESSCNGLGALQQPTEWPMNPNVGEFEIQAIQQMSDDDFEMYLDNAVMLYCQSHGPMPPHVFRSLLVLLRYCDEEGDLEGTASQRRRHQRAHRLRDQKASALGNNQLLAGWSLLVTAAIWSRPAKTLGGPLVALAWPGCRRLQKQSGPNNP